MKKRRLDNSLAIPGGVPWTVEDWKDFHATLVRFKARFMRRHSLDQRGKVRRPRARVKKKPGRAT